LNLSSARPFLFLFWGNAKKDFKNDSVYPFVSGIHTPTISMRNLCAGVYYFQISDGVTSKTVKVLKN
jgi:hypothetical protein